MPFSSWPASPTSAHFIFVLGYVCVIGLFVELVK